MKVCILSTGHCTADESHVLRGGRRGTVVVCPARVAAFDHPRGTVLFDAGYSAAHLFAAASRLPHSLYLRATPVTTSPEQSAVAQGVDPTWIVVSHFHADHVAGLKDFPKARFVAAADAWDDVRNRRGLSALRRAFLPALIPDDFAARADLLGNFSGPELPPFGPTHDLFGDGLLRLVRLPGHARGQLGLYARTDDGPAFFVADAAYCRRAIAENRPPHPMTGLFVDDAKAVRETLAKLHAFAAAHPEVALHPTHEPPEEGGPHRPTSSIPDTHPPTPASGHPLPSASEEKGESGTTARLRDTSLSGSIGTPFACRRGGYPGHPPGTGGAIERGDVNAP